MSLRRRHAPKKGFTLIEVLMAAVVMLAGIVGMMQAVTSGAQMLDVSRKQSVATQIIHNEIEKIRVSDWSDVSSLPLTSVPVSLEKTSFQAISPSFQCSRAVSYVRADDPSLLQVTYTVTWVGNTGRSYTRSGSTYVGKNGLYVAYQR